MYSMRVGGLLQVARVHLVGRGVHALKKIGGFGYGALYKSSNWAKDNSCGINNVLEDPSQRWRDVGDVEIYV